jgi:drug/metabolite transporter (DMT)-like permease
MAKKRSSTFHKWVEFAKDYRIQTLPEDQYIGIKHTLLGWFVLSLGLYYNPIDLDHPLHLLAGFSLSFACGCVSIIILAVFDGLLKGDLVQELRALSVQEKNDLDSHHAHLSKKQRIRLINFRGVLASTGFIALVLASRFLDYVDNTAIFGADPLLFTLVSILLFGTRVSRLEWIGIMIALSGILAIVYKDLASMANIQLLVCGCSALFSAISMSVIFLISPILVRHDPPIRIALYQVAWGLILSIIFLVAINEFSVHESYSRIYLDLLNQRSFLQLAAFGIAYTYALFKFLKSFLHTRPILLAIMGYTLPIMSYGIGALHGETPSLLSSVSNGLITLGCYFLVHKEHKKSKTRKKGSKPLY